MWNGFMYRARFGQSFCIEWRGDTGKVSASSWRTWQPDGFKLLSINWTGGFNTQLCVKLTTILFITANHLPYSQVHVLLRGDHRHSHVIWQYILAHYKEDTRSLVNEYTFNFFETGLFFPLAVQLLQYNSWPVEVAAEEQQDTYQDKYKKVTHTIACRKDSVYSVWNQERCPKKLITETASCEKSF